MKKCVQTAAKFWQVRHTLDTEADRLVQQRCEPIYTVHNQFGLLLWLLLLLLLEDFF